MSDLLHTLQTRLERGESLVLASILTHEGSTPRSAGSRMLLAQDAETSALRIIAGTVGGGLVEAQVMRLGAEVLADGQPRVEHFELTNELAANADMICGGRLSVLLERLEPAHFSLWRRLAQALAQGQRCLRLVPLHPGDCLLLLPGGEIFGALADPSLIQAARQTGESLAAPALFEHAAATYALEPWTTASPLFILGAGHVSRPTARIAALCGFAVTVLDDRADFANAERFPQATVRVLPSFNACLSDLPCGPLASIVIVTRGHAFDAEVLAQALRTSAGYIGMIGSSRKRASVYQLLRDQGFTDADLARVHCPIGLDIGAETPEEIAVSITAELVLHRAGGPKKAKDAAV